MSTTDTQVQNLIVNKLSYDQWTTTKDAGDLSPTEAYEIIDLDNTFDTVANKLTNCVLEIPQKLKLELSSNTLTVKAGSKLATTGSTYSEITVSSDISLSLTAREDGKYIILSHSNTLINPRKLSECTSGPNSSLPSSLGTWNLYFDTTNKVIYHSNNGTPEIWTSASYPLCILEVSNGNFSFAKFSDGRDCIFNGLGFIGQTKFIYPGVKVLEPIGKNADGTLKSRVYTTDSLQLATSGGTYNRRMFFNGNEFWVTNTNLTYNADENLWYQDSTPKTNGVVYLGDCYTVNDIVTNFTLRQPVRLATTEMVDKVQSQVDTNTTAISGKANDSDVVHKTSNETITGEKTFADMLIVDDNIRLTNTQNTYRHVFTNNSAITKGTAPSANTGTELVLRDSNNVNIGSIATWYNTSGTICTALRAYNPTAGTTDSAVIQINYTADGKTYATAPTPAISDDSNKIATTEWVNDNAVTQSDLSTVHVIVETYVNGTNWYRIYDDGWVEQGGKSTSGTSITITFLKEFVDTNYTILGIKNRGGASGNPLSVSNVTTTTVTFATSADAAPVYWYACGIGII